jgi:hypothetical protein
MDKEWNAVVDKTRKHLSKLLTTVESLHGTQQATKETKSLGHNLRMFNVLFCEEMPKLESSRSSRIHVRRDHEPPTEK